MRYLTRTIFLAVCPMVLSTVLFVPAQEKLDILKPKSPVTFALGPHEKKTYGLQLKTNGFAEVTWLANEELDLLLEVTDSNGSVLAKTSASDWVNNESLFFIAPREGCYELTVSFGSESEIKASQNVSIELNDKFVLPSRSAPKDLRKINGYDVKIVSTPDNHDFVVIEKRGVLYHVMKAWGEPKYHGFSFADKSVGVTDIRTKKSAVLVGNTLDKTGDNTPDVMLDYYSGGAHCCSSSYFINLGDRAELVESINTGHSGMSAIKRSSNGGLVFETGDNNWAYWPIGFAGSPFPSVTLEFHKNKLMPNFELMRRPPPSLVALRKKAQLAKDQLNSVPYEGEESQEYVGSFFKENMNDSSPPFYSEMLDLIYSGNEELAWQFFDLVWPQDKKGKDLFRRDFNKKLSESHYWQLIQEDITKQK